MRTKTKIILTVSSIILNANIALAVGTPYLGGSVGINNGNVNLFGGYGWTFGDRYKSYLGTELNVHGGLLKQSNARDYGVGISLMPGIKLTESTMIYTRLGVDYSNYSSTYLHNFREINPLAGIGIQTALTKKIDFRGEYIANTTSYKGNFNLGLVYKFD